MKRKLLTAATAAALCAGSGGVFADQPEEVEITKFNSKVASGQWDLQQLITVCSNNGRGNNHETVSSEIETVTTGAPPGCVKFVNSNDLEFTPNNNQNNEPECPDGRDCDPKPND